MILSDMDKWDFSHAVGYPCFVCAERRRTFAELVKGCKAMAINRKKRKVYPMKVVCGWCKEFMSWSHCYKPDQISHGICPKCVKNYMRDDPPQQDFL